jgi:hypothetical protein
MMRYAILVMCTLIVGGCAAARPAAPRAADHRPEYSDAPATSLAFAAPITLREPPVMLDRELREPGVFLGYEDLTATYFYIRSDDWQVGTNDGRTFRRAVAERVGVTYR